MTTYWTVIALVIGAAVLVVLAIWSRVAPGDRRPERRWVALGSSGTAGPGQRSWVAAIATRRRAEAIDLTAPGATLAEVRASQVGPALAANPTVAVLWIGASDLLHGLPLPTFQRDLADMVAQFQGHGCLVLLVGLPAFRIESVRPPRRRGGAVADSITEWQAGIVATAGLTRATLVDFDNDRAAGPLARLDGPVVSFDQAVLAEVGQRIGPVLDRLLREPPEPVSSPGQWDEPADPVARRRLGLPPVR